MEASYTTRLQAITVEGEGDIYRPLCEALDKLLPFPGLWSTYVNLHQLLPICVPEVKFSCPLSYPVLFDASPSATSHVGISPF